MSHQQVTARSGHRSLWTLAKGAFTRRTTPLMFEDLLEPAAARAPREPIVRQRRPTRAVPSPSLPAVG